MAWLQNHTFVALIPFTNLITPDFCSCKLYLTFAEQNIRLLVIFYRETSVTGTGVPQIWWHWPELGTPVPAMVWHWPELGTPVLRSRKALGTGVQTAVTRDAGVGGWLDARIP